MGSEEQGRPARSTAVKPIDPASVKNRGRSEQDVERELATWQQKVGLMISIVEKSGDGLLKEQLVLAVGVEEWSQAEARVSGVLSGAVAAGIVNWVRKEG